MRTNNLLVNARNNRSLSYSENKNFGGTLQLNRKLSSTGRNITVQVQGSYSDNDSRNLSMNDVRIYKNINSNREDSAYQTNRYNLTPQKNYNYSGRITYSEPIMKATYLQFSYEFQYKYTKSDRSTYDFSNMGEGFFGGVGHDYRNWNSYLSLLPNDYENYYDRELSKFSEYKNYIHDIQLMLRVVRQSYNLNLGVTVMPQKTQFAYRYLNTDTVANRHVTNITPTVNFRWKISKVSQLRLNYRGSTSQPSMTQLLPITDNSDPLNITLGNPGLKPSFTNRLWANYNNYIQKYQRFFSAYINYSTTRNSTSNMVTYHPETGGRTTQPVNINGNWNISGNMMFNTAIDTTGFFSINSTTEVRYANHVGYITLDRNSSSQKNYTKDLSIYERLGFSFRNDWLEVEPGGSLRYNHATNELQPNANLDTWDFSYGFNTNILLPWNMSIATDLNMNSRRGYTDESLNTNELIWNAQISQSFLRNNALTFSLQFYDILQKQSNFSRSISAMQRTDTEYNAITSYAMLHVIYRMNLFGTKEARREMRKGPGMPPGDGPGGNRGNRGGNRGGFGGGGFGGGGFGGGRF